MVKMVFKQASFLNSEIELVCTFFLDSFSFLSMFGAKKIQFLVEKMRPWLLI